LEFLGPVWVGLDAGNSELADKGTTLLSQWFPGKGIAFDGAAVDSPRVFYGRMQSDNLSAYDDKAEFRGSEHSAPERSFVRR